MGWYWLLSSGSTCNSQSTDLYSMLDEDIDSPVSTDCVASPASAMDYIRTIDNPPGTQSATFELANAPSDLGALNEISVRTRIWQTGGKVGNEVVEVRKSDGTLVGTATAYNTTTTETTRSPPTVVGPAFQGEVLSANVGIWDFGPTSYAYQWRRCDSAGASCTNIAGATASTGQ